MTLPFFDRIASTSIKAYCALDLPARERAVLDALRRQRVPPTSYELFAAMRAAGTAFDLNSVRPRLTELSDRGVIVRGGKRTCTITGKSAYVWAIKEEA